MAGIYIHIPFCKRKCNYCDFYSVTNLKDKSEYIKSLRKELENQIHYLNGENIETVYFGGGTPSLLSINDIDEVLASIRGNFKVIENAEITLEANPDDISEEYLFNLKNVGINRFSLGVQSFNDAVLKFLNRRHSAQQAINSINLIRKHFTNYSVDLIYGIPNTSTQDLIFDLNLIRELEVPHLSAYHLTYESNTPLTKMRDKKKFSELQEDASLQLFETLIHFAEKNGYEQYEISNFARNGLISNHNTNYWRKKKYLGIGAGAHSFNGEKRQWNFSDIKQYISGIQMNTEYFEFENLTLQDKYNELIMISLRTKWGVDSEEIKKSFGESFEKYFLQIVNSFIEKGLVSQVETVFTLTNKGKLVSNSIISDLLSPL